MSLVDFVTYFHTASSATFGHRSTEENNNKDEVCESCELCVFFDSCHKKSYVKGAALTCMTAAKINRFSFTFLRLMCDYGRSR